MSFSMERVKRNNTTVRQKISNCSNYLNSNYKLTSDVIYALWQYVEYRYTKRNNTNFTAKRLQQMVEDLLEHILNKPYDDITYFDVYSNENIFIKEIAKAIYYGATKHLYYAEEDIDVSSLNLKDDFIEPPQRLSEDDKLEKQKLEDYFKGLIV